MGGVFGVGRWNGGLREGGVLLPPLRPTAGGRGWRGGRRQVAQGKGLATEVRAERWARDACGGVPAGGGAAEVRAAAHQAASWKMLSRAPLKLSGLP